MLYVHCSGMENQCTGPTLDWNNTQASISPEGKIVHNRRKIKPTHIERAYCRTGEGGSLKTVVSTPFGNVGGLTCWEHAQPLLQYYEYEQDVDIQVASWPAVWDPTDRSEGKWSHQSSGSLNRSISQVMAFEGACCVMVCSQITTEVNSQKNRMENLSYPTLPGGGFSQIFGFAGKPLCEAPPSGEEAILYADIDLKDKLLPKIFLDVVGHYSRPDLLSLCVNTHPSAPVHYFSKGPTEEE